jgi:hypothetical protein
MQKSYGSVGVQTHRQVVLNKPSNQLQFKFGSGTTRKRKLNAGFNLIIADFGHL